jgi:hypothetical protein
MQEDSMSIRSVKHLIQSKPTDGGAGVHLRHAFGFGNTSHLVSIIFAASVAAKAEMPVN